jgi:hypothetical protein
VAERRRNGAVDCDGGGFMEVAVQVLGGEESEGEAVETSGERRRLHGGGGASASGNGLNAIEGGAA